MSGGATPQSRVHAEPAGASNCPTCAHKKKPKVCTLNNDNPDDPSDGSVVRSYDPEANAPPPTLEEVNQALDEKLAPWELFNGIFGGFDPANTEFNFGRSE